MTMSLETLIEELRAELSNTWDPAERRLLIAELDLARAELQVIIAQLSGARDSEPPF
ncbi:hypothetical protein [Endobacterium cereale]|uniref:hypothetical protein n=1 Tax=Endobacterium cereale TaxID=2663029 RepID=UPI001AD95089|nr:hypothetical protein [Endobacterium cereale]MEB2846657.1 hypothetical protein [Endobacterium cereale]